MGNVIEQLYKNSATGRLCWAVELTADNVEHVARWCGGYTAIEHDALDHSKTFGGVNVPTPSGNLRASEGDYIIKTPIGEFYVDKPGRFKQTFELIP